MHKYRLISKKGEGTFSEVLKAQSIKTGQYTAIKCMKNHFDSIDQVNNLREIQALQRLSPNPHIVKLFEVLYDQPTGRLALVFELMTMNIYELIRGRRHYLPEMTVKKYMFQLTQAMDHMHRSGIFHRDIKPENILIRGEILKVADFGSCRGIYSKQPYTEYISTRWYRAPECLLTDGYYGYKMDMWGVGCVAFEVLALYPLFPGTNELDQIKKIHKVIGTPTDEVLEKFKTHGASHIDFDFPHYRGQKLSKMIPHVSPEAIDLVERLIRYEPEFRLSARQALRQPWFQDLRDTAKGSAQHRRGGKSSRRYLKKRHKSGERRRHNRFRSHAPLRAKESDSSDTDGMSQLDIGGSYAKGRHRKNARRHGGGNYHHHQQQQQQDTSDTSGNESAYIGEAESSSGRLGEYRGGKGSVRSVGVGISGMGLQSIAIGDTAASGSHHPNRDRHPSGSVADVSTKIGNSLPRIKGTRSMATSHLPHIGGHPSSFQSLKIDSRTDKGGSDHTSHNSRSHNPYGSSSVATAVVSNTVNKQYQHRSQKPRYHRMQRKRSGISSHKHSSSETARSILERASRRIQNTQMNANAMLKELQPRVTGRRTRMTEKLTRKYQSPYSQAYIQRTRALKQ